MDECKFHYCCVFGFAQQSMRSRRVIFRTSRTGRKCSSHGKRIIDRCAGRARLGCWILRRSLPRHAMGFRNARPEDARGGSHFPKCANRDAVGADQDIWRRCRRRRRFFFVHCRCRYTDGQISVVPWASSSTGTPLCLLTSYIEPKDIVAFGTIPDFSNHVFDVILSLGRSSIFLALRRVCGFFQHTRLPSARGDTCHIGVHTYIPPRVCA